MSAPDAGTLAAADHSHADHSHAHGHADVLAGVPFAMPAGVRNFALTLIGVGAALTGAGFAMGGEHATWRLWANLLIAAFFFTSIAVGGGVIMALMNVTKAGWGVAVRRIPEALTTYLPVALLTMLAVGFFGMKELYEWSDPNIVAADHLLRHKSAILNPTWYFGSMVLVIGGWAALTGKMRGNSIAQDSDGNVGHTGQNIFLSVIFLIFFGLSMTLGALIWLMSLEPHWFSTMFGVYQFAGAHKAGAAVCAIIASYLITRGHNKHANVNHLHNFGLMMFAFSTFWAYIWVSQFLLIWYANIPEETGYYLLRHDGLWMALFALNVILNWVIPFFALLPRPNKRNPKVLVPVAVVMLLGLWLDVYLQVMPAATHFASHHHKFEVHGPTLNAGDFGGVLLLGGVFVWVVMAMLGKASLVPTKDPYLAESLHHEI